MMLKKVIDKIQKSLLTMFVLLAFGSLILTGCVKGQVGKAVARVKMVTGDAVIENRGGNKKFLKIGYSVRSGDTLYSANGVVVLHFNDEANKTFIVEIQQNTIFYVQTYLSEQKIFSIKKGNALFDGEFNFSSQVQINTPNAVIGMRGNKLYSFKLYSFALPNVDEKNNVIHGVCFCNGEGELILNDGSHKTYFGKRDDVLVAKNGKIIVFSATVLKGIDDAFNRHEHTQLKKNGDDNASSTKKLREFLAEKFKK